jgi:hypothetical protein
MACAAGSHVAFLGMGAGRNGFLESALGLSLTRGIRVSTPGEDFAGAVVPRIRYDRGCRGIPGEAR